MKSRPARHTPRQPAPRARRSRTARLLVPLLAVLALVGACTSGGGSATTSTAGSSGTGTSPETAIGQFVSAWQSGQAAQIAPLTSDPGAAEDMIGGIIENLGPSAIAVSRGPITIDGDVATTPATFVWSLPGGISWKYEASWTFDRSGNTWVADWTPTLVNPQLQASQTVGLRTTEATGGQIVDRNNQQLVTPTRVYSVVAIPGKVTDAKALATSLQTILKSYDATVTVASVTDGISKANDDTGYTVTNLREADYQKVKAQLDGLTGLTFPTALRDLPPTKDFARTVLSEATPVAQELTSGTAGWRIVVLDSTGSELDTLAEQDAVPGKNAVLTLDSTMQQAAEKALATVTEPAVLVAIQPSTGEILTVAQNAAANAQGPLALMGQYPPGSTFKIVTGTAAIDAKLVTPDSQVACPSTYTIDSRPISNDEDFDLGTVSLTTSFAKSCNTTFAELASRLTNQSLHDTALEYGVGLDFVIPGITTLTGQAPVAESDVQRAEDGFGQGVILVTPFSAALMAATAASDNMPTPTLIRGQKTTVDQAAPDRSAAAQSGIRTLMRAVVTDGTGTLLQDAGEVYAKTGTADNGPTGTKAHAWTVGYRGDVAFAVLIVNGDSSKRTTQLAAQFLESIPAG
ncbi:penicillin-binding protein [Nakamurella sp. YIM 132087]|uniref:Penicillin-binding protein n=1 Tax=Nakamurella alba TaxID=2665158 RepID=A0A7K1FKD3_9ACTN|nr:penicillin-binding transpeptidase domain-containing protein [Nakamurella alba]MTD13703.1 penicillin-binding protein [Nakamurella alba]